MEEIGDEESAGVVSKSSRFVAFIRSLHILATDVPPLSHGLGGETVAIIWTFNRYTSPPLPARKVERTETDLGFLPNRRSRGSRPERLI